MRTGSWCIGSIIATNPSEQETEKAVLLLDLKERNYNSHGTTTKLNDLFIIGLYKI
jgi:hypothetical protein